MNILEALIECFSLNDRIIVIFLFFIPDRVSKISKFSTMNMYSFE